MMATARMIPRIESVAIVLMTALYPEQQVLVGHSCLFSGIRKATKKAIVVLYIQPAATHFFAVLGDKTTSSRHPLLTPIYV